MKTKAMIIVCFLSLNIFAINGYSPYKIYQSTDTLTHANLDSNISRGSNWSAKLVDTLDKQFIRFSDVDDSNFTQISIDTATTDILTADTSKTRHATADSVTIPVFKGNETHRDTVLYEKGIRFSATDSILKTYKQGIFLCTLKTNDFTDTLIDTAFWTKIGNSFTCSFPYLGGTSNSTTFRVYCQIPYYPMQDLIDKADKTVTQITDNDTSKVGLIIVDKDVTDYINIFKIPSGFTASNSKAFGPATVQYITEN